MNIPHPTKRIFLSYAIEDKAFRDFIYEQERDKKEPFEIVEMLPNNPWDPEWSNFCCARIKGCDGVIILLSENSKETNEQIFEIQCTIKEKKQYLCMYIRREAPPLPWVLKDCPVKPWNWDEIEEFVKSLDK